MATYDRSGLARYTHLVRSPDDPKETVKRGRGNADVAPHLTIKKTVTVEAATASIRRLMADGAPRTFNRICVELTGRCADVLFEGPYDVALWKLVEEDALVLSSKIAPIRFRLAEAR